MVVAAHDPGEIVRLAGGWMVDRALTGWDIRVLTDGHAADRSMRILGARCQDLESALAAPPWTLPPRALAVDLDLYGADVRIRRLVSETIDGGAADCRFWSASPRFADAAEVVEHRLSAAAQVFKAHALAALGEPSRPVAPTETFRSAALLHPFNSA